MLSCGNDYLVKVLAFTVQSSVRYEKDRSFVGFDSLDVSGLRVRFGSLTALDNVSLTAAPANW